MSWPVGKCPNMERSDLFSLIGKQKKIAPLIAGHPVAYLQEMSSLFGEMSANKVCKVCGFSHV